MNSIVTCEICGYQAMTLAKHIRLSHDLSLKVYRERYPEAEVTSEQARWNISQGALRVGTGTWERTEKYLVALRIAMKNYARTEGARKQYSKMGKLGGIKAQRLQRERQQGWFSPDHYIQSKGGKASCETKKERGISVYSFGHQSRAGKIGGRKAAETNRRNKTSAFFDTLIQRAAGLAAVAKRRKDYPYWFMGVPFDSKEERKMAMLLNSLCGFVPEEGVNCHVKVGGGEIDFKVGTVFLEYHPCPQWYDGRTIEEYKTDRRQLLDKNGYRRNSLIVVDDLLGLSEIFIKGR